jgi:Tol biopolymer transport system component
VTRTASARRALVWLAAVGAFVPVVAPANAYPRPGVIARISLSSDGAQGNGGSGAVEHSLVMTPDGRYVAFVSAASNLVPGDLNMSEDVFVRDLRTGKTKLASVSTTGTVTIGPAGAPSLPCQAQFPSISDDGRYVAFASCRGLDGHPGNLAGDVYVHDFATGTTTRASVTYDGKPLAAGSSMPSLSADGRYVAFQSSAGGLVRDGCAPDAVHSTVCSLVGGNSQVYVRDLKTSTNRLVSVDSAGAAADGKSSFPSISADGRLVAFTSEADNLVSNDHNVCLDGTPSCADVYVRDLRTGVTQLISVAIDGLAPPGVTSHGEAGSGLGPSGRTISRDDTLVAFQSAGDNLVPNGGDGGNYAMGSNGFYVRDLRTRRTQRVSVDNTGSTIGPGLGVPVLAGQGRYVAFDATPPCPGGGGGNGNVAVHDLVTGTTTMVDRRNRQGAENPCSNVYNSFSPALSANGSTVAFGSDGTNLVSGDTNGKADAFWRDLGPTLGVGGLARSGALSVAGARSFASTGVVDVSDATGDVSSTLSRLGADLVGGTLAYRASTSDIFVRVQVARMLPFALVSPGITYAVDLSVGARRYELRIGKVGTTAVFTLYQSAHGVWQSAHGVWQSTHGVWRQVGPVQGGYGTTGQEVVAALPLAAIGAEHGAQLTGVRAVVGFGTVTAGISRVVDSVAL